MISSSGSDGDSENPDRKQIDMENFIAFTVEIDQKTQCISFWTLKKGHPDLQRVLQTWNSLWTLKPKSQIRLKKYLPRSNSFMIFFFLFLLPLLLVLLVLFAADSSLQLVLPECLQRCVRVCIARGWARTGKKLQLCDQIINKFVTGYWTPTKIHPKSGYGTPSLKNT
jgi:hypothetical protein